MNRVPRGPIAPCGACGEPFDGVARHLGCAAILLKRIRERVETAQQPKGAVFDPPLKLDAPTPPPLLPSVPAGAPPPPPHHSDTDPPEDP